MESISNKSCSLIMKQAPWCEYSKWSIGHTQTLSHTKERLDTLCKAHELSLRDRRGRSLYRKQLLYNGR